MSERIATDSSGKIERRSFLQQAIVGLASLVITGFAVPSAIYLFARKKSAQTTNTWADAGDIGQVAPGVPQEITFLSRQADGWNTASTKTTAWLIRDKEKGSITAFSPLCTHLGCAYHWENSRKEEQQAGHFVCPCHGSRFDVEGKVLSGPATRPLDRYPTKVEGSRLWILASNEPSES